jgi:hypothetical protein
MAWTNSKIFTSYLYQILTNTSASAIPTDALLEVALFDNTITPSQTDTAAHNAYAAAGGQWASGGVVDTGTGAPAGWPALGRPLVTAALSAATVNPLTFSAANTVSASVTTTLTNAYGCLVYDHSAGTPTDMGFCYNYFGGGQTVTLGTFTIAWNASGIFTLTL